MRSLLGSGRYPHGAAANVSPSMLNERLFAATSGASGWRRLPTIAADAMVATSHPLATREGGIYSTVEFLTGFSSPLTMLLVLRCLYGIGMGGEWGLGASLAME